MKIIKYIAGVFVFVLQVFLVRQSDAALGVNGQIIDIICNNHLDLTDYGLCNVGGKLYRREDGHCRCDKSGQ